MIIGTALKIELKRENCWSDGCVILNYSNGRIFGYATTDIIEGKNHDEIYFCFEEGMRIQFGIPEIDLFNLDYNIVNDINFPYIDKDGNLCYIVLKIVENLGTDEKTLDKKFKEYQKQRAKFEKYFDD